MIKPTERKQKANELRKAGDFKEALTLYRSLWEETGDEYDGSGLLHCLRKLELFDEAIVLARVLIDKYPDFGWCRIEVIWTLISGMLYKLEETEPLEKVVQTAREIMDLNPDGLAKKMVVFKVLKSAKASNHWEIVNQWVVNIEPTSLSIEPMTDSSSREGWSDQSLWYNYRINGLIQKGDPKEAIGLVDEILEHFPKQRKFFLRLKALANYRLGNLPEAEKIYKDLCSRYRPDWWMLHEYANVVREAGRCEDALKLMYRAASVNRKLESMVSLLVDIGMLCKEMELYREARGHLLLCVYIREEKGWSIAESITDTINDLNKIIGDNDKPPSLKEALNNCRVTWTKLIGKDSDFDKLSNRSQKAKKRLIGKLRLGRSEQPFCFIYTGDERSIFCFKSDLPSDVREGSELIFDAVPSFDKKKNKESWKAVNIRYCT